MKANVVEMQECIWSQIWNYEDLLQFITGIQASHAWVFKSMEDVMHTYAIPSLGTLTEAKTKKQVQQELDSYFNELMRVATSPDFPISVDIMHKYVARLTRLRTMLRIVSDELQRGVQVVYMDAM